MMGKVLEIIMVMMATLELSGSSKVMVPLNIIPFVIFILWNFLSLMLLGTMNLKVIQFNEMLRYRIIRVIWNLSQ